METVVVSSQIHTNINALCAENADFVNGTAGGNTVTTLFSAVKQSNQFILN